LISLSFDAKYNDNYNNKVIINKTNHLMQNIIIIMIIM